MPLSNAETLRRIAKAERETKTALARVAGRKGDPKLIKTFEDHLEYLAQRRAILKGDIA